MTTFEKIDTMFEKQKDFYKLFNLYGNDATKYALLRSLDNKNLSSFLVNKIDISDKKNLLKKSYYSNITIDEIINFILSKKEELIKNRNMNEAALISIVEDIDIVSCGIRNDSVDEIIKPFVRNKNFSNINEMTNELDNNLLPRIRNYVYWSYFNQLSNDLIENSFYSHPAIIPTLRKIHDIDFFIKINNKIVPFDLKITHISDDFFNIFSENLIETTGADMFLSEKNNSEIKEIKTICRENKSKYNLPNYGKKTKLELLEILTEIDDIQIKNKIKEIYDNRLKMVQEISKNLKPLEWWNYKFQGERLFSNNNRFFVFLVHANKFLDGKDIKKEIKRIRQEIKYKLDNLSFEDIHKIKYVYEKDKKNYGEYTVVCTSLIIIKE